MPLIGITTYTQKNQHGHAIVAVMSHYLKAVIQAGGAPVLIPPFGTEEILDKILNRVDGILFTGGGDISPDLYSGESHASITNRDKKRDDVEIFLLKSAISMQKPILGICRGLQVINVSFGGKLYAHIPDQHPNALIHNRHSGTERQLLVHEVDVVSGTRLEAIVQEKRIQVNSLHHQGIHTLAPGLLACGYAPDGLIEAVEIPKHPFAIGVQWHPEWLTNRPETRRLFRAFVDASTAR